MKTTFYFLVFLFSFSAITARAQTETEPNQTFQDANFLSHNTGMTGNIGCSGDLYDYYKIVLPTDGTIKFYMSRTNISASNGATCVLSVYSKNQNSIQTFNYGGLAANASKNDTSQISCRAADTFYVLVNASICQNYTLKYEMIYGEPVSAQDINNNDSFSVAPYVALGDTVKGKINYLRQGYTDANDYYKTYTQTDGTVKIMIERTNTSQVNGFVYLYVYDKNELELVRDFHVTFNANASRLDSVIIPCRAADTLYFRIGGSNTACFKYSLSYKVINNDPVSALDMVNNDTFSVAPYLALGDTVKGNINYIHQSNNIDVADFYKTYTQTDGTVKIMIERTNTSLTNSRFFYVSVYDKNQNQIVNEYHAYINSNITRLDSILIPCRAADTLYFRIGTAASCFKYKLSYTVVNNAAISAADMVNNDSFSVAPYLAHGDTIIGNIQYISYNGKVDNDDYYKTLTPIDGTVKVMIERTNTADINSQWFYVAVYDKTKTQLINNYHAYINSGIIKWDSLVIPCRAADTLYLRVHSASACFKYKLSYSVQGSDPVSIFDQGNNDSFAVAKNFSHTDTIKGNLDYISYNGMVDENDFYKTLLPSKGTMIVYLERTNTSLTSQATSYFGIYNKSKAQIFINYFDYFDIGETRIDTIYIPCLDKDSIYFRLLNANACFKYKINYEMTLGDDKSVLVCPGTSADISNLYNTKPFNSVTWSVVGGGTMPPLNNVPVGQYQLIVQSGTQTCTRDTALVTISITAKPTLGNDTTAYICAGNTANLTQFKLTTGLTPIWLGTSTPTSVGAGNYTLIATNNNGCADTVNITIIQNPKPNIGADVTYYAWIGESVNFVDLKDTTGYSALGLTPSWTSNTNGNTGNTIVVMNYSDTSKAVLIATNSTGCKDTALVIVIPANKILPASAANRTANAEITATDGWTHYYFTNNTTNKDDDLLLLSLKKNGNVIGTIGSGNFQVKNNATANAGMNTAVHVTSPLITNSNSYYTMNRYWEVIPNAQPTSKVNVRYYYNTQDVADANSAFAGSKTMLQMVLYHLKNGNPDPTSNWAGATLPIISIMNKPSTISDTTWVYTNMGHNQHRAEFTVGSFSGGSAGFTGNNLALPLQVISFTATAKEQDALINWQTEQESNMNLYILQRSFDGQTFKNIATLKANNEASNSYQYRDEAIAQQSKKVLYRLQMEEQNGHVLSSEIITLLFSKTSAATISVYPNPAHTIINITGLTHSQLIKIIDAHGKVIKTQMVSPSNVGINIQQIPAGLYQIQCIGNDEVIHLPFVKYE